ncbi:MAG: HAD family hydrolase [Clostridia bacterium]|nr:HAD family hydrolase [Clostridia bacterium]
MIKSVIFDLDDTLYDFTSAHAVALRRLTAYAGANLDLSPERFEALHRDAFRRQKERLGSCAAIHNRLIRFQLMLEAVGKPVGYAPEMADLYWNALLERIRPMEGAIDALASLRFMGLTVGIGSNMTADWQYAKLKRLGLMTYVDFIVTSEEAGVEKPDAALFRLCAEKAGCAPGECAFVGDNLKGDALGALDAGMTAFWLCRSPEPADTPDGVTRIQSLSELPALIESH